jgi:hypothetical protein
MDIPELTPQRQKMLIGTAAAGLLLVLGFSFAPRLDVADQNGSEVDDVLTLVEEEFAPQPVPDEAIKPRPFRRARSLGKAEDISSTKRLERPRELPLAVKDIEEPVQATPAQVVPPAYQQRLELLAEEEAVLLRHQKRRGEDSSPSSEPVPTVTVASVEAVEDGKQDVEHALAEARRPGRWRRVELMDGTVTRSAALSTEPRGARLSGSIEIE